MPVGVDTYTKLLMHCEGTDAATTFRDGSFTHRTLTSKGTSAQIDTAQFKFGAASGLFNAGYVYAADSDDWHFDGNFTIDLWVRHSSLPSSGSHQMYISQYVNTSTHWNFRISNTGDSHYLRYEFVNNGSAVINFISSAITITTGAWHHVALVRNGSIWNIYYDGVDVGGCTDADSLVNLATALYVGSWGSAGGYYFYGWMDEVRVSKGIARWTEDFTPPTEAYWLEDSITDDFNTHDESAGDETDDEVDSSTMLLLHAEGADASITVTDSSPTHRTITVAGTAQIDTAQFVLGAASLLLDGNSDYVTAPDSDDWYFGTGDFTIDMRVRFAALPSDTHYAMLVSQYQDASNYWRCGLYNAAGTYKLYLQSDGGTGGAISINRTFAVAIDTWYHFAVTRAGSSFKFFLDGVQVSTEYISSYGMVNAAAVLNIGSWNAEGEFHNGWIDELRIVKGKAIWTASFTPPTAPYAILDHTIEALTTNGSIVPDPGLPTDAEITDSFTTNDYTTHIAGLDYYAEIDEDICLADAIVVNQTYNFCVVDGTVNISSSILSVGDYPKGITEDVTTADSVEGQYNISMNGSMQFPLFETAAYTGLGFNSGDMNFPVFTGVAYAGARSSVQEIPKFGLSGSMKIQYPFSQNAKHPKFSGVAEMTIGKVVSGNAGFPKFSGTGTMIGNPQLVGDADFPVFGGNGGMSVGGRFANYVLRYVR